MRAVMMRCGWVVALLACLTVAPATEATPVAAQHDFGSVLQGTAVEHAFVLRNPGDAPLRITGVRASEGLAMKAVAVMVPPRAERTLSVALDTARLSGPVAMSLVVAMDDGTEREFRLGGQVMPPIEVRPRPAFFVSTQKGQSRQAVLDLYNHEAMPVTLSLPTVAPGGRYRLALQELEPGRHFRLTLTVAADAPAGRFSEFIALTSSSRTKPKVPLGVNLQVRERVYTFPDAVDFGSVRVSDLGRPAVANTQTLMVYRSGGRGFSATPDLKGMRANVTAEPGPQGDRVQVTLALPPDTPPGPLRGTLVLRTSDAEFAQLEVPVTGQVVE